MRTFRYLQTFQYLAVDEGFVARGLIRAETRNDAIARLLQRGYSRVRVHKHTAFLTGRLLGT